MLVDAIFVRVIISLHSITEVSAILFKYLLFSQIHVVGWNYNLFCTYDNFYIHIDVLLFHYWFELHVVLLNLHLQSHAICFVIFLASILFVIILNALTFMSFVSFRTHIFGDKTLRLLIHLFKLITNRSYLSSTGFKSIRVGLTVHSS